VARTQWTNIVGSHGDNGLRSVIGDGRACAIRSNGPPVCWGAGSSLLVRTDATQIIGAEARICGITPPNPTRLGRVSCASETIGDVGRTGHFTTLAVHAAPVASDRTDHTTLCASGPDGVFCAAGLGDANAMLAGVTGYSVRWDAATDNLYLCGLTPAGTINCTTNGAAPVSISAPYPYVAVAPSTPRTICAARADGRVDCYDLATRSPASVCVLGRYPDVIVQPCRPPTAAPLN
jgi:hypothetical protein